MKEKVAAAFSAKAHTYNEHARVQRRASEIFLDYLKDFSGNMPEAPVLEIGCGTGFVTRGLLTLSGERHHLITDIAPAMVELCGADLRRDFPEASMDFSVMDGEVLQKKSSFGLVVSGFTIQWFTNLASSLEALVEALLPGGLLALSFQGDGSFAEWKNICDKENLPFSANPLPDGATVAQILQRAGCHVKIFSGRMVESYPSPKHFFRSLGAIGAGTSLLKEQRDPMLLSRIMKSWTRACGGRPVEVSYRVHFVFAVKPEDELATRNKSILYPPFPLAETPEARGLGEESADRPFPVAVAEALEARGRGEGSTDLPLPLAVAEALEAGGRGEGSTDLPLPLAVAEALEAGGRGEGTFSGNNQSEEQSEESKGYIEWQTFPDVFL
ncbi:methyltransferase domain-containing protein [Desulfobotulus mexicanus]|uniref:Methyltransferase domain-containing protein n=1 Tax=Desulfobotulus mexicanus TaxID=2586642 RepID=A0A5Q4VA92_9BACT|nr:methyltransferase domain-containing protein [Desulfobotulus mexicanus]TYT74649.1 methyltransferase domain-containing protein [Desulfobotulus mexicanus]